MGFNTSCNYTKHPWDLGLTRYLLRIFKWFSTHFFFMNDEKTRKYHVLVSGFSYM